MVSYQTIPMGNIKADVCLAIKNGVVVAILNANSPRKQAIIANNTITLACDIQRHISSTLPKSIAYVAQAICKNQNSPFKATISDEN